MGRWNDARLEELDEWQDSLGQPFFTHQGDTFKAAFDLLTPDLIVARPCFFIDEIC